MAITSLLVFIAIFGETRLGPEDFNPTDFLFETVGARAGEMVTITSQGDSGKSSLWMDTETGQLCSTTKAVRFRGDTVEITTTVHTITDTAGSFDSSTHPQITVETITKQEYFKRKLAGE